MASGLTSSDAYPRRNQPISTSSWRGRRPRSFLMTCVWARAMDRLREQSVKGAPATPVCEPPLVAAEASLVEVLMERG